MFRPKPTKVKRVAVIGLGTTGQQWVTLFRRHGLEVVVYDPAYSCLQGLAINGYANMGPVSLASDLITAVAEVDFVQECGPPELKTKLALMTVLDTATYPGVIIASSTANWAMTMLQQDLDHPERCIIGHPFSESMSFVEVIGGQKTDPTAIEWAVAFYAGFGQQPCRLGSELPGFLTSRLRDAVWREAAEVVSRGLTTVAEIDAMMTYGSIRRQKLRSPA